MGDMNFNMMNHNATVFKIIALLTLLNVIFIIILRIYRKKLNLNLLADVTGWVAFACVATAIASHFIKPYKLIYEGFGQSTIVNYPLKFYFLLEGIYLGIVYLYVVTRNKEIKTKKRPFTIVLVAMLIVSSVYFISKNPKNLSEEKYEELYVKMGGRG